MVGDLFCKVKSVFLSTDLFSWKSVLIKLEVIFRPHRAWASQSNLREMYSTAEKSFPSRSLFQCLCENIEIQSNKVSLYLNVNFGFWWCQDCISHHVVSLVCWLEIRNSQLSQRFHQDCQKSKFVPSFPSFYRLAARSYYSQYPKGHFW